MQTIAEPVRATPPPRRAESHGPIDLADNTQIGRFGLIRELARGGMGQVFLARDTQLGRKVAIKFLLRDDPEFVSRFLIEARATARCTHENIVTIYEVGEHAGLPYMVLEYLEGKTLSEVLKSKPTARQLVELMVPVARALERAHEHGIVHRDLKPSNIFVTDRGQVKVLDFGVARVFDAPEPQRFSHTVAPVEPGALLDERTHVTFTKSGSLVGTLPYMSPEQWGADEVDHLSDIWAVGIIFWRALVGVHPAGATTAEKLKERLTDLATPLPSIATRDQSLPNELVALVDGCLAKRKSERWANASHLLAGMQAFLAPRSTRVDENASPYRGLAAFGEQDARYFFGRTNEIRTALAMLDSSPLLAVIGPSGVGKSSFVHAGLVPAARAGGGAWRVRVLRPGRTPLQRLVSALDDDGIASLQAVEQLRAAPGLFGELARRLAQRDGERVMIVVDQMEELFTLSEDDEQRELFLAALAAAADDPTSPVRVVLSIRADFLDRLAAHKWFFSELARGLFFLSPPDRDNLRETLERPAELAGYAFEDPQIVEDMLRTATSRGALPLLSFAASRLWSERDRKRRLLTLAAYQEMGGVGGAFAGHADQVVAAVPAASQLLLRAILLRLVTPEGTRAIIDHAELASLSDDRAEIERILDQLVQARLVHVQTDPDHGATVEIVHEALITEWPTLRRWLDDSQAARGFVHELKQAAKQWAARGKTSELVWRGATAQDALSQVRRHVLDLSALEREFLAAVRKQLARGRRRKVLVFTTIFTALGLVIAGGAVAVVRIAAAEKVAEEQAETAKTEAKNAQDAKAEVVRELQQIRDEQQRRAQAESKATEAESKATEANAAVRLSRDELERANGELRHALGEAQTEKQRAQAAADVARKATDDAKAANARTEALLAKEKEHVRQLELEKKKIFDGGLK
jgi:serine/threonine protein kinase